MPKLIDHVQRREELAEAVWRVIVREGVSSVSVRSVALEAGLSAGSLRHVLPSKGVMLAAAMQLVLERATRRFLDHPAAVSSRADAVAWLGELLPLDRERQVELEIQLALVAEAAGHPELQELRDAPFVAVRQGCLTVLGLSERDGLLRPGLDLEDEATRLHVLVDGLALHLVARTRTTTPAVAARLLDEHLAARWR